jgi:hypothetical protein
MFSVTSHPVAMETLSNNKLAYITFIASLGGFLFGFDMAVVSGVVLRA